ncbi:hypothetical protein MYX75_01055 [Acidobacteria bacterium AH-259-A15]|nr:hypothetical protein [Acidobacteria bacterium AH-259-A15]
MIQAEEALQKVTEIALGFGSIDKHESRRIISEWQRAIGPKEKIRLSKKEMKPQLAAIGIGVTSGN